MLERLNTTPPTNATRAAFALSHVGEEAAARRARAVP